MKAMHLESYGPAVAELLKDARLNALGPGEPDAKRHGALAAMTPEAITAPRELCNREMALACTAGLWLRNDFLHESHEISQNLANASGSYWHGIMHRREPDFDNAKYWFRRVGNHPVFARLHDEVQSLASQGSPDKAMAFLLQQSAWDPLKFVDLCERAGDDAAIETLCRQIQRCEWKLLFDYCYREAIGETNRPVG